MTAAWLLTLLVPSVQEDVRALKLQDETRSLPIGGSGVTTFADLPALRKKLEEDVAYKFDRVFVPLAPAERRATAERLARTLAAQVDFAKERVVWVRWTTGGPPDGRLAHEVREGALVFYVQAPAADVRGERALSRNEFFAVPAGLTVSMEPGERPPR